MRIFCEHVIITLFCFPLTRRSSRFFNLVVNDFVAEYRFITFNGNTACAQDSALV